MNNHNITPFNITSIAERGFVKFYITHPDFKGRIKKHIGKGSCPDYENYLSELRKEIDKYFVGKTITLEFTKNYVGEYVERMKHVGSIFNHTDEFINEKRKTLNKSLDKPLTKSTINTAIKAIDNFKKYLITKNLSEQPEVINQITLDDFFHSLKPLKHNYRAKLHCRLKEYIKFLNARKGLSIDKSYLLSTFSERYDNQETGRDDRSLTVQDMEILNLLRTKFKKGKIELPAYKTAKTISPALQSKQRETKLANLKKTLDCFLFMCATGMYVADINKIKLTIKNSGGCTYLIYRRAKNNSYCPGIPLDDYKCFLGETIRKEYGIKSGTNFPLNLSLNHFDKNLKIISSLAGLDFILTSKMARKTFASRYYFDYDIKIGDLQMLLGHSEVSKTKHYLRITDDDFALKIRQQLNLKA